MNEVIWNPWHGCHKISEGCLNCYMFKQDSMYEIDSEDIHLTKTKFKMPIAKDKYRDFKIPSGSLIKTCLTSDFFLEEADEWRGETWKMIKERDDCIFLIITKRVERIKECLPSDWNDGYKNVIISLTVENQKNADYRIPIFLNIPVKHKSLTLAPLLENIDIFKYLDYIEEVYVAGESDFYNARECKYDWILNIREQCSKKRINFIFFQTGSNFTKNEINYKIKHKDEYEQAKKANINLIFDKK